MKAAPEEFNLMRQKEAFQAIEQARRSRGVSISDVWRRYGICINSLYAWSSGQRTPSLKNLIKVADAFGFDVLMVRGAEVYDLKDTTAAMHALDKERLARRMPLTDMEEKSGVSLNSFYAWRSKARTPALCNIVALSQTFGFEVIMRRRLDA